MLLTLLLLRFATSKTTVASGYLGINGTLFAFRDDFVNDPLEARTWFPVMIGERVARNPAAAKDTGARLAVHDLCHLHNLAREMKLARLSIVGVPNLIWQDPAVAA